MYALSGIHMFEAMVGKGRHPILGLTSSDPVLSLVGPIGLAASVGTALIVDLMPGRPDPTRRSLRDMVEDGPTASELSPGRKGVAVIRGGGVTAEAAVGMVERLAHGWPAIVVRVSAPGWGFPVVPAMPVFPGHLLPSPEPAICVWQPVGGGSTPPGPGPVLPRLRPGTLRLLLAGRLPRSSGWIAAWRPIWEMPWG